jgi:hypothetical protein
VTNINYFLVVRKRQREGDEKYTKIESEWCLKRRRYKEKERSRETERQRHRDTERGSERQGKDVTEKRNMERHKK